MRKQLNKIIKLEKDIRSNKILPVYFFYGDEPYFIENMINLIVNKVVDKATKDFNLDIFNSEETNGDTVVTTASSFPMMSDKRVVIVKNIQKFSSSSKKRIEQYIDNPNESTVLILTANKINAKTSFYQKLIKKSSGFESPQLYEDEARAWIIKKFKLASIKISPEAALYIVQNTGTSQWALFNEVDKIALYFKGKDQIELEDIFGLVGHSKKYNTWEFTETVFNKKLEESITILTNILTGNSYAAVGLISSLSERAFILLKIRHLIEKGVKRNEIPSYIAMWPFLLKRCMVQVSGYSKKDIISIIDTLFQADLFLKTGRYDQHTILMLTVKSIVDGEKVVF